MKAVSLSASNPALSEPLARLRDLIACLGMELVWDLPVPYSALNPVWLEVQANDPTAIGKRAVLYIEPDGDVLPTQGRATPVRERAARFLGDPLAAEVGARRITM